MTGPLAEGWITIEEAEHLTGYCTAYLRRLANQRRVDARKVGRDWVFHRENLLAYKERMDTLGTEKHNPWREDLVSQGRGRQPSDG
jgi:hypothetical protein